MGAAEGARVEGAEVGLFAVGGVGLLVEGAIVMKSVRESTDTHAEPTEPVPSVPPSHTIE